MMTFSRVDIRLNTVEGETSELEDSSIETSQNEVQRENKKENQNRTSTDLNNFKKCNGHD